MNQSPLEQVVDRVFASGRITRADQKHFLSAMLAPEPLSKTEQTKIRGAFERLRMGLLKVMD
ncbi:hypothetical protein [Leptolyngbya sp. FACHB-261]|uniref:hypothetical protein n=1 Tax=Leptolyngbya sp. FACHB-261 TaxID=2692806 RepID=UPI001686091F|nr:hypothetical protein [Leptolyngbya sp. FACHB-261]MBD2104671.1 hypothetical protein [Leptolyngbya sp. FACHB-261]